MSDRINHTFWHVFFAKFYSSQVLTQSLVLDKLSESQYGSLKSGCYSQDMGR